MELTANEKRDLFTNKHYPKSAKYDFEWVVNNQMGSNCLWLAESIAENMELKENGRLLDFGCGKAISSIFLSREYKTRVWAADLWIDPTENWNRICESGMQDYVFPIKAEAHQLPFAHGFFDEIISINSLQFYATSEYYLKNNLGMVLKKNGYIGVVMPGLYNEIENEVPEYIRQYWDSDFYSWHTATWWKRHFERSGIFEVKVADTYPDKEGHEMFRNWGWIMGADDKLVENDKGRNITFVRVIARKK